VSHDFADFGTQEAQVACSGRDELCRSVLNDEWVSHPTWASEDNSGFQAHKKNIYEEAMHRCEEERHEFDFHLEAMSKTISALENINMKIQQMTVEEKSTFKLKPGLGLPNKSIYQRILRKVYGKDAGTEVITTLHDCPAVAVPIVLQRLKAKDEDWRRAQREWNKVWREVDARNFYKSLDHQGITFKVTDKKALTAKALVSQIEIARDEQVSERGALLDPSANRTKPVHQLAYRLSDTAVIKDATKLTLAYLDRLPTYSHSEKEKFEKWLLEFLVLFFVLDKETFEKGLAPGESNVPALVIATAATLATPMEEDAEQGEGKTPKGKNKQPNGQGVHSGDLRKKLLNKGSKSSKPASHAASRASPGEANGMEVDPPPAAVPAPVGDGEGGLTVDNVWIASQDSHKTPAFGTVLVSEPSLSSKPSLPAVNRKTTFFTNTTFYVFLCIFQVYSTHSVFVASPRLMNSSRRLCTRVFSCARRSVLNSLRIRMDLSMPTPSHTNSG
jgi:paired amphipathic helix protein Sin3a